MRNKKPTQFKLNYRTNSQIRAEKVRVIDEEGKQLGVLSLQEALKTARESERDLIEIAPKAVPPVAKIIEFGKFKYQEEKKLKKQKKSVKGGEVKEIRFSPFIGESDYETRRQKAEKFLKNSNKIRAVVKFKGREMGSKQFGYKLLERFLADFGDKVVVDMKPKFLGRHLAMVISPTFKGKSKQEQETNNKTEEVTNKASK